MRWKRKGDAEHREVGETSVQPREKRAGIYLHRCGNERGNRLDDRLDAATALVEADDHRVAAPIAEDAADPARTRSSPAATPGGC